MKALLVVLGFLTSASTFAFPVGPYLPLSDGISWSFTKNGASGYSRSVASGTVNVNGYPTKAITYSPELETYYFSNGTSGIRLHQIYTPSVFVAGCGYVTETDTYVPP